MSWNLLTEKVDNYTTDAATIDLTSTVVTVDGFLNQ